MWSDIFQKQSTVTVHRTRGETAVAHESVNWVKSQLTYKWTSCGKIMKLTNVLMWMWSNKKTFVCAEDGCIDQQQQDVVEEALQHGRLHLGIGQVLAAHRCPTDQQRQDLAHGDGLQQMPGGAATAQWVEWDTVKLNFCNEMQFKRTASHWDFISCTHACDSKKGETLKHSFPSRSAFWCSPMIMRLSHNVRHPASLPCEDISQVVAVETTGNPPLPTPPLLLMHLHLLQSLTEKDRNERGKSWALFFFKGLVS